MKTLRSLMAAAIAAIIGGCANEQVTVLHTVGPAPSGATMQARATGDLIVYTAVKVPLPMGVSDTQYYPHTSYALYDANGKFLRGVRNHIGAWDEEPERVSLPPGRYTISAESELQGSVKVPIIIQARKTTVVNLQRISHHDALAPNGN